MDLSRIIVGPVITEKSECQKVNRTYTLTVHPHATKVDVRSALKQQYDVDVASVRVLRTIAKHRMLGAGRSMKKRPSTKRMLVTLTKKSHALDLAQFRLS